MKHTGARYHVTCRGNSQEKIFNSDDDRVQFLAQLDLALVADKVILYAYCMMPNHYHLLVETPLGKIRRFMLRLNGVRLNSIF